MEILLAILLGGFFGLALYYAGATSSSNIRSMLSLRDLTLMKTILFAIGFAALLLSVSILLGIFNISHLSIKTTHLGVVIGGLIFGIGFGWAGSCPGTCVAGSGVGDLYKTLSVVLGALLGAFAFSITYGTLESTGLFSAMNIGSLTLFNISDKFPSVLSIGYGGLSIMGLVLMAIATILPERFRSY